jgi:hypothetical protein
MCAIHRSIQNSRLISRFFCLGVYAAVVYMGVKASQVGASDLHSGSNGLTLSRVVCLS